MIVPTKKPSHRLTEDDAIEIWVIFLTAPDFQNRIAARFDCNQGRISEVLNGKKFPRARTLALIRIGANDNPPPGQQGRLL